MAYKTVRALEKGLDLLVELNRRGRAKPAELARETGIDRTTVYRLLETLMARGLVERSPSDDCFTLRAGVRQLSEGFTAADATARLVAPELGRLLPKVLWPSDFAAFERGWMVIRETTHRYSPFSVHRAMVGRLRPFLRSAMGRAVLAGAEPAERSTMVEIALRTHAVAANEATPAAIEALVSDVQGKGYATSVGGSEDHISAIALPVQGPRGVVGAINIVFFRSALSPEVAAERYLPALRETVRAVEERLALEGDGAEDLVPLP
ncbi:helix-turn-helix domain-containing protein [Segnochrobactraceae bacterium EtOH-i3]